MIGLARGESYRVIGARIGRPASTVSREVERNGPRKRYRALRAQALAEERAQRPKTLPRLKVAARWAADPGRVIVEAEALRLAGAVTPDSVPQVVDLDPDRHVLLIEHAPATFRNWKAELLAGRIEPGVAARLGDRLACWHTTPGRPELTARFGSKASFRLVTWVICFRSRGSGR